MSGRDPKTPAPLLLFKVHAGSSTWKHSRDSALQWGYLRGLLAATLAVRSDWHFLVEQLFIFVDDVFFLTAKCLFIHSGLLSY